MKKQILALIAAAAMGLAPTTLLAQDIKIGFNGDLSASPSALVGQSSLAAIEVAIEDINAAGGVLGRKLVLVVRDDLSQPPKSIQNTIELVDNDKVVAMFGPLNSGNALAVRPLVNQKKMPMLIAMATSTDITKPVAPDAPNYVFRISLVDRSNISALLAYLKKHPNAKKIGFMVETTGYGQAGLKDLQELATTYGIVPVASEKFGVNDTDMSSQLNKMRSAGVDTLVIWAQATPLGQVVRSMERLNYFPLTLSSFVADQPAYLDTAGPALVDKLVFQRTRAGGEMTPEMTKLQARIKPRTKLGEPVMAQASQSYDAMMLLAQAIRQAQSTDSEKISAALEDLKTPHKGLMKTYNRPFSTTVHEGLTPADLHWVRWKGGKVETFSDAVTQSLNVSDFKQ
ncbi:MAG: branched-chain amino acid ABC transporter substrate-binding protein [Comamonadaceae bacterium]|nr:MAG: branched-chain amino acid ABC transporter substrate-binding protein [Comamonadaceae bacterium]